MGNVHMEATQINYRGGSKKTVADELDSLKSGLTNLGDMHFKSFFYTNVPATLSWFKIPTAASKNRVIVVIAGNDVVFAIVNSEGIVSQFNLKEAVTLSLDENNKLVVTGGAWYSNRIIAGNYDFG